jgi:hypothetical protein
VHIGLTLESGHDVAWVRAANGLWYKCNDDNVEEKPIFVEV